jgi:hypothetical protein
MPMPVTSCLMPRRETLRCAATCWQVFTANIKTKHKEGKWVMAGVALLMDVV